ncbi:DNA primase [Candidatus Parcubacteria bacterium]|nr:DNA primase [Candidatus Parcubacteria bacterium]
MSDSEEIKARLDIVDVIREYIQLQPSAGNFRACCPFHKENTPSFMVSPEKQIWHCFGCGKGGDMFSFVQEIDGLSFPEALRLLAPKAGVTLKRQSGVGASKRNRLLDILDLSKRYFNKVLLESPKAENARKYLKNRGLTEDQIIDWQIGYSFDSWDSILNFLKQKKYTEQEILKSGMTAKAQNGNKTYDRFRGRIMFPIDDVNGNTVAFTARVSPEKEESEKQGKYINSPQTDVYDKSRVLFGLYKAKSEIRSQNLAVIVEGQMDVITAYNNGFKNVVASSGTALTAEQIKLLKRFTKNIDLAFDMDEAGQLAADRGIKEASKAEMNINVIEIPNGKDPDDCIKNNIKEWRGALQDAKPVMQYYFDKIFNNLDLKKIEDKRKGAQEFLSKIIIVKNKIDQDYWLKKLSEEINVEEYLLRETLSTSLKAKSKTEKSTISKNNSSQEFTSPAVNRNNLSIEERYSENLLALALKYLFVLEYLLSNVELDHIFGVYNRNIYKKLVKYYNINEGLDNFYKIDYNNFKEWFINEESNISENQLKSLDKLVLLSDKEFAELDDLRIKEEATKIVGNLKKLYFSNKKKILEKKIMKAEQSGDENQVNKLLDEFKSLSDESFVK